MSPRTLLLAAALAAISPAGAETFRVDDSASRVLGGTLRLKPVDTASRGRLSPTVYGQIRVNVRLDLRPWAGRQGRVYLTLPSKPDGSVVARWTSQGRLLAGVLRGGERTLVYAGPIPAGMLEDTLELMIEADGSHLRRAEDLLFAFEIEPESP